MSNPVELALVKKALALGLGGCVEWDAKVIDRVAADLDRYGLTLKDVRKELIEHVRGGGEVLQVKEVRTLWVDRRESLVQGDCADAEIVQEGPVRRDGIAQG